MHEPREERGSARRELIAIQKRLYKSLRREVEKSLEGAGADVKIYLEEYERDLRSYQAVSSRQELISAVVGADVVYVGDYHTLPHSQRALSKLLVAAARRRREVILAVELVHARDQPKLDAFLKGQLSEDEFLAALRYEETWGFDWRNYRDLFVVGARRGVRVVGINSDPLGHERDRLLERDFRAAEIVVRETLAHPKALVVVFDGDLHVARDHLPLIVDTLLHRAGGATRKRVIVHQNSEAIYWLLANERREHDVDVVRLADDAFCVLNATPIEKLQSYLNWESERAEMTPRTLPNWEDEEEAEEEDEDQDLLDGIAGGPDYAEQVLGFVRTIARFLGIERDDLDDFELFTVSDLDWLDAVEDRFTKEELEDLKRQVASGHSYFIPRSNIIYLANAGIAGAAEEATHFLHAKCAGIEDTVREPFPAFYQHCVTEALGFFGSKLIDHKRECWTERDCELFVRLHAKDHRLLDPPSRMQLLLSSFVMQHKKNERRWLETNDWRRMERIYRQPSEVFYGACHILGHMLGDKLYQGLVTARLDKEWIRELFFERLGDRTKAFLMYLELVAKTHGIEHAHPSRGERM